MGATKEQAEKTKQDLIDAALNVFSSKGFNVTRLEDISKEAGVTRGAFYWHFKNKLEVFAEVHRYILGEFLTTMKEAIDKSATPVENLRNVLLQIIIALVQDEKAQRCGKLFYLTEYTPEVIAVLTELKKELGFPVRTLLSKIIEEGKNSKEIRDDMDTESVFKAAISTIIGTADQVLDNLFPITEKDAHNIVTIFIDGIRNKTA